MDELKFLEFRFFCKRNVNHFFTSLIYMLLATYSYNERTDPLFMLGELLRRYNHSGFCNARKIYTELHRVTSQKTNTIYRHRL